MLSSLPTILIADDEPNICRIAKLIIPSETYNVITAENGIDAYEKAVQYIPDIIFSDILMPKCDGFELCQKLKQNETTASIPFLFLTGVEEKQFKNRMLDVKADDFLSKPFSSSSMIEKIEYYVKPLIHSENNTVAIQETQQVFQFGIPELDKQLYGEINPQSFVLIEGEIGSGKSNLTRQFILDGIQKKQKSILLSFETPNHRLDPVLNLSNDHQPYVTFCDASQWTSIHSQPWRNIDFVYDFLYDTCANSTIDRIIIDSFSHGFAFWPIKDILKFVDLCRHLPNAENQCVLWTINYHDSIATELYHLQHVMDIGIKTTVENKSFNSTIQFAKWQSYQQKTKAQAVPKTPTINNVVVY